ncbi:MAG TPA: molecular chaperone HtpG [Patescibacteria group bacterium]|nr:molecular chaperone HtpG [Patescibacteria group bacterium]
MTDSMDDGTYEFKAEINQLLDILIHSLYKERDIFLRELVSNASDALTRVQFEMLTNQEVLDPEAELAIRISVDTESEDGKKHIVIKDSGIGMEESELIYNLGTIAQSGAREFLAEVSTDEVDITDVIGQFGVGFYSVFMVAEEIRVISRSFRKDSAAAAWISDGGQEFRIEAADKIDRGTEIHITLRADAAEYADPWALKQIVKKYSDFVSYPIYVGEEQANQQLPLWRKAVSDVTPEEYNQFYQQMTMDFQEPLMVIPFSSDAPLHVRAILYIPSSREKSVLNLRKEPGIMLYSHNVMIQEYSQDLLPNWLGFVDGVVDSEDLPLNVSRESIQNTRIIRQLAKTIRKRILRELQKIGDQDDELFGKFWRHYGRALKEGLATEPTAKDELLPLFRFYSSKSGTNLITLGKYVDNMADEQTDIYYVLGDDLDTIAFSPHLDPFTERDIEVLYLADPLDSFIAPLLTEYDGKKLINVDAPELQLTAIGNEREKQADVDRPSDADFNRFVGRCVTTLGNRITEVRQSKVLRNSAVRLVSPEDGPDREIQRLRRYMDEEYKIPARIFEVNRDHPLITDLSKMVAFHPADRLIDLAIEQLYENALVVEGLHPNPATMLPRIQQLMEFAVERSLGSDEEE